MFPIDRAFGIGEGTHIGKQILETMLGTVEKGAPPTPRGGSDSWFVGHGVGFDGGDQMVSRCEKRKDNSGAGIIGIGDQVVGDGDCQGVEQSDEFIQKGSCVAGAEDYPFVDAAG